MEHEGPRLRASVALNEELMAEPQRGVWYPPLALSSIAPTSKVFCHRERQLRRSPRETHTPPLMAYSPSTAPHQTPPRPRAPHSLSQCARPPYLGGSAEDCSSVASTGVAVLGEKEPLDDALALASAAAARLSTLKAPPLGADDAHLVRHGLVHAL